MPFGCSRLIVTRWIRCRRGSASQASSIPPQAKPCFWLASVAVFFFASWAKCYETWECDEFPRAQTPFERALHVRTTPFASVGDILKAVGEEDRGDFRYCHLASAIRTHFRSGHYGTCQLCAHTFPFARRNVGASEKAHPDWVPVSLKSKSWELARSLCDSGSIVNIVRLLSARVEEKRPPPFEHVDALAHVCNYWSSDRDHRARAACRGASRAWRTMRRSCWSSLAPASTPFAPRRLVLRPL